MACGVCGTKGQVEGDVICTSCGGSGIHVNSTCSWCGGRGTRRGMVTCQWCGGSGGLHHNYGSGDYSTAGNAGSLRAMGRGMMVVMSMLSVGAVVVGVMAGAELVRTGSIWKTLAGLTGFFLFVLGFVTSFAIPYLADLISPGVKASAFRLLLWMLGIVAAFVALQIAYHQLLNSSLVHLLRETLREPLSPVRQFISPAELLERVLPDAMGGTIWLIAFVLIVTLVSAVRSVREGGGLAHPLAAFGVLIGTLLLL